MTLNSTPAGTMGSPMRRSRIGGRNYLDVGKYNKKQHEICVIIEVYLLHYGFVELLVLTLSFFYHGCLK
jgi:hypothetical protein